MSKKIQQYRGLEKDLPRLEEARIAFTTDTKKAFVGSDIGNIELAKKSDINERGISVKDFGAKGDGITDDTSAIQRAFNECDELYFPDGIYKITNTLNYDGRKAGNPYRFAGRSITFSPKAKIILHANVNGIVFRGSGSVVKNMYIEVYSNILNYNSTVITLEALDNHTNACESNMFDNLKIIQSWGVKKGTAIEMIATGASYIYKNKFTNFEINHFYYGIKATTSESLGINSNIFNGSIWASQQSMNLNGASGNVFNVTTQNTSLDPDNPELANVYVNGEYNQFIGLIYDVGFNELVKYAYEFGENGSNNSIGIHYKPDTIKNPHGKFNYLQELSSSLQEQFALENNSNDPFTDYRDGGGEPLPIKTLRMISGLDNSLGRKEIVESISATSVNMQFGNINPLTNPSSVREVFNPNKLLSDRNDNLIFGALDVTKPSSFELKINLANTTQEFFLVKSVGALIGNGGSILSNGNVGQMSVKVITKDNKELVYDRIGGDRRKTYHTNNQILFTQRQESAYHWNNQTKSIVISFTFPANSFTRDANIAYLYANIVSEYGNSGSFAYIGGDTFGGDIEFKDNAGVVLKSPNGVDYRLGVKDDGGIVWQNKSDSSIIELGDSQEQVAFRENIDKQISGYINVKSFGAKGDGITDDTVAIQNAINAIDEQYHGGSGVLGGHTYTATSKKLFFPQGIYRITNTIIIEKVHKIDFGSAIIRLDTESDIFAFSTSSYNSVCSGGVFSGKKIFNVFNWNEDQGLIIFENMEFKGCEVAIRAETQSSKFIIQKCKFDDVIHPLIQIVCDDMQFKDNWCQSNRPTQNSYGNIVVQDGRLTLRDNMFIPLDDVSSTESAWIDFNGFWLMAENNRFSDEAGNRCAINWKKEAITDVGILQSGLSFKDNLVGHSSDLEKTSAIRIFKLPNHMYIENNYYGVLMNYIVSFTEDYIADLETQLTSLKNEFKNASISVSGVFAGNKYSRFSYRIKDNNFYLNQRTSDDLNYLERQNEWYFLSQNYKSDLSYIENPQDYTLDKDVIEAQDILYLQDAYEDGNRIVKLPLSGIHEVAPIKISCSWNRNYRGATYHQVQELIVFYIMTYENDEVAYKIGFKNLLENTFDLNSNGIQVEAGVYDINGDVHFDGSITPNYKGICLKFSGENVLVDRIRVYK